MHRAAGTRPEKPYIERPTSRFPLRPAPAELAGGLPDLGLALAVAEVLKRHGYQSPIDVDGAAFAAELARLQRALFAFLYGDLDYVDDVSFTIDEYTFRRVGGAA